MNLHTLNIWAILVAAVSAFALGAVWYAPFALGGHWKKANGFAADPPAPRAKVFMLAFVLSLVMAFNLAMFLHDPKTNLAWGATAGFLAGFGWVAMGIGIVALFERRPFSYVLVNGGYLTIALVIMGTILGAWR
jgi:hypothetical protein